MSQLVRNLVLFISQICPVPSHYNCRKINCEGSETSSRRVRDTCDDFATIWQGILSHKIFEHVQNFREPFETLCDTSEEIANHCDCFKTALRLTRECKLQAVETVASQ